MIAAVYKEDLAVAIGSKFIRIYFSIVWQLILSLQSLTSSEQRAKFLGLV